jgi:hypothetical protein
MTHDVDRGGVVVVFAADFADPARRGAFCLFSDSVDVTDDAEDDQTNDVDGGKYCCNCCCCIWW